MDKNDIRISFNDEHTRAKITGPHNEFMCTLTGKDAEELYSKVSDYCDKYHESMLARALNRTGGK